MDLKIRTLLSSIVIVLSGCQTSQPTNYLQLDKYLNSFIGQTSQSIQKQIDFKSLGYQAHNEPDLTPSTLTYTILRPVNIPGISSSPTVGVNAMGVPVIRQDPSMSAHYDINFNCKVIFNLKNNIAQSIDYFGKAC